MIEWQVSSDKGFWVGVGLIAGVVLVDAILITLALLLPLTFLTFVLVLLVLLSFGLVGLLLYWLLGLSRALYELDRNAFIIHWGPSMQIVPMGDVKCVLTGEEIEGKIRFVGGRWPGHCVGYGEIPEHGTTLFYAVAPPRKQIYVVTEHVTYAVSPADREGLLESLRARLEMGSTQVVDQESVQPGFLKWAIWRDWLAVGLWAAALVAVLALFGFLTAYYPLMKDVLPLHFDAHGMPDRFGPAAEIFVLPLAALLALLANGSLGLWLYRREPVGAYLLWGSTVLVQVLAWAATVGILARAG